MSAFIRERRDEDLPELAELLELVQLEDDYPTRRPEDAVAWLAGARTRCSFVADDEGELVGHVSLAVPEGDHAEATWRQALGDSQPLAVVKRLFVHPRRRQERIGARLLEAAVARAHEAGQRPVLDVDARSEAANRMYLAAGFEPIGELELSWPGASDVFVSRCYLGPPPPAPDPG